MSKHLKALVAGALVSVGFATPVLAETAMERALAEGAERMTADQIAERLAGKTVTFEMAATGDQFLAYYDGVNGTVIRKIGADSAMEGFYAVTVSDHICLGFFGDAPMRLRCVNVLLIDGAMHKFELDGSLRGHVVEETDGNTT